MYIIYIIYVYLYMYTKLYMIFRSFVRIYNQNTNHFYLYYITGFECLQTLRLRFCSRARYDSFRVPPCTRTDRIDGY